MSSNQTKRSSDTDTESAPTSRRVSSIAHDAIDSASGKAEAVEKKLRAEAGRIAEKSNETAAHAKEQFDESLNRLDTFVREKPFAAAGIAFAIGALGTFLIKR